MSLNGLGRTPEARPADCFMAAGGLAADGAVTISDCPLSPRHPASVTPLWLAHVPCPCLAAVSGLTFRLERSLPVLALRLGLGKPRTRRAKALAKAGGSGAFR